MTGNYGTVIIGADGSYTYTPGPNAQTLAAGTTATDGFTYGVSDAHGATATAGLTITVTGVNDNPVAVADEYTTPEDTPLVITAPGLLANDSDIDGDTIKSVVWVNPTNGTVSIANDGSFVYTPNPDFNGIDSFYYAANDGGQGGVSTPTLVTINVTPVNDNPIANPDAFTVGEDDVLTGSPNAYLVQPNDTDPDGDSLTAVSFQQPTNGGAVVDNGDGTWTYTPGANAQALNNGQSLVDTFEYTISDGNGGTAVGTVSVTVLGADDATTAIPDLNFENGSLVGWNTGTGAAYFTGPQTYVGSAGTYVSTPNGSGAAILSPIGSQSFADSAAMLGLSAIEQQEIVSASPSSPTNAAWMSHAVHLQAGTTYTMAWNFVSTDYTPFGDGSITTLVYQGSGPTPTVTINDADQNYALLGYTTSPGNYSTGDYASTGWQTATYEVSQTGDYLLGFAVFNGGDMTLAPQLLVDDSPGTTLLDGQPYALTPEA